MKLAIEKLQRAHAVDAFDCGNDELNRFLKQYALQSQASRGATTYVGLADTTVIGYYSIRVGEVEYDQASERLKKGLGRYPIPIMILARLAVDLRWQKQGVGQALLRDATLRTLKVADEVAIRAIVVHAKDAAAQGYYQQFDFTPSPTDPLHLWVLVKDIQT